MLWAYTQTQIHNEWAKLCVVTLLWICFEFISECECQNNPSVLVRRWPHSLRHLFLFTQNKNNISHHTSDIPQVYHFQMSNVTVINVFMATVPEFKSCHKRCFSFSVQDTGESPRRNNPSSYSHNSTWSKFHTPSPQSLTLPWVFYTDSKTNLTNLWQHLLRSLKWSAAQTSHTGLVPFIQHNKTAYWWFIRQGLINQCKC